jgi:hypothetical protein
MTLTLLLAAVRDIAKERSWLPLATEIEENYLVHKFRSSLEHYKVLPRLRDRKAYLSLLDGHRPTDETQILRAYDYYRKQILSAMVKDEETLRAFFATVASSLDVVIITLSKDESPTRSFGH